MGYNANIYKDSGAYYVRRTMDDDAVFAYVGHGSPGYLFCTNSDYYLSAYNISSDPYNYSLQYAFYGTTNKLKNIRFAYYGACHSNVSSSIYGRLTYYTTNTLGALAAMGFNDYITHDVVSYFGGRLFAYLHSGHSVNSARLYASNDSINRFGTSYWNLSGVDTASITGDSNTRLRPAAYGN